MCGSRHQRTSCCGRRERRQPLLAQAVIAGTNMAYNAYNKRKEQKAIANTPTHAYPDTLDAVDAQYRDQPAIPALADSNAMYSESDEKHSIPTEPQVPELASNSRDVPPPAYEEFAPPAGPPPSRADDSTSPRGYPTQPVAGHRPRLQRSKSSASSVSSASSISSVSSNENVGIPLDARGVPVLNPRVLNKKLLRHGRKPLRKALKRAGTKENAQAAVLTYMASLFAVPASGLELFKLKPVDPSAAVLLSEWARRTAKSKVNAETLVCAGIMANAAGIIAGASKKLRLGRR